VARGEKDIKVRHERVHVVVPRRHQLEGRLRRGTPLRASAAARTRQQRTRRAAGAAASRAGAHREGSVSLRHGIEVEGANQARMRQHLRGRQGACRALVPLALSTSTCVAARCGDNTMQRGRRPSQTRVRPWASGAGRTQRAPARKHCRICLQRSGLV